jgi:hypothetical protein
MYHNKLDDYVGMLEAFLEPNFFQEAMDDPKWQVAMEGNEFDTKEPNMEA